MAATLTIDRTNMSLAALVIGSDTSTGYTLDPSFSIGSVTWRKRTEQDDNVAGRLMIDYTRDVSQAAGSITCHGTSETDLQSRLSALVAALTQVDATLGFQTFTMTYAHGAANYQWTCTEPADITLGDGGSLNDMEMASYLQSIQFTVTRDPIPLAGPI